MLQLQKSQKLCYFSVVSILKDSFRQSIKKRIRALKADSLPKGESPSKSLLFKELWWKSVPRQTMQENYMHRDEVWCAASQTTWDEAQTASVKTIGRKEKKISRKLENNCFLVMWGRTRRSSWLCDLEICRCNPHICSKSPELHIGSSAQKSRGLTCIWSNVMVTCLGGEPWAEVTLADCSQDLTVGQVHRLSVVCLM